MRKKSFVILVFIAAFIFVCMSGCSSNILSNSTNSSTTNTTTTTEPTTLSEEEILKNRIKDINESVIKDLKEKCDFLNVEYSGYVNFQDYIRGAESNPDDFFFVGTTMYNLSKLYDNTKFYKNSDVLKDLKEMNVMDADYLFEYKTMKKDAYGKEEQNLSYVLVQNHDEDTGFQYWVFECPIQRTSLDYMIMSAIVDKCNYNH